MSVILLLNDLLENNCIQEQSEGDFERDRLQDQLVELKEQNEKMEGLVNFLEEEKIRLREKMEKMMAAGEQLCGLKLFFNSLTSLMLMYY